MENTNAIAYDPFVMRQFKPEFKGTNLSKLDSDKMLELLNLKYSEYLAELPDAKEKRAVLMSSDWDFCKYLVFSNPVAEIKAQVVKIDLNIYPFIRSAYSSRVPGELPILSRWAELPPGFKLPTAEYIVAVLYSRDQLKAEHDKKPAAEGQEKPEFYLSESVKYGVVAIMGTAMPMADPLVPVTMMRNALGMDEGGNGVPVNRESYMESVRFWDAHILVKQ